MASLKSPKLTIHQLWFGDVMPARDRAASNSIKEQARKNKVRYKLWSLDDIRNRYGKEEPYLFFRQILFTIPFASTLTVVQEYYRWRILADTKEGEQAIVLDTDIQCKKLPEIKLPNKAIIFGKAADQSEKVSPAFIGCTNGQAAQFVADKAAAHLMEVCNMDTPRFLIDFLKKYGIRENTVEGIGSKWLEQEILPALKKEKYSYGIVGMKWFAHYGQSVTAVFLHNCARYCDENVADRLDLQKSLQDRIAYVEKIIARHNRGNEPAILILMSSALDYNNNPDRTLGVVTAKDIRRLQRETSFAKHVSGIKYYFVMGEGELDPEEKEDSCQFRVSDSKEKAATRMVEALNYFVVNGDYDYIFLCEDDTYIVLSRLKTYCKMRRPDALLAYGCCLDAPVLGGGILLSAAMARKIALLPTRSPIDGEAFGDYIMSEITAHDGSYEREYKFSSTKSNYPAPTNGIITSHGCNIYDLVDLAGMNLGAFQS